MLADASLGPHHRRRNDELGRSSGRRRALEREQHDVRLLAVAHR
jgi:hypothetical protein